MCQWANARAKDEIYGVFFASPAESLLAHFNLRYRCNTKIKILGYITARTRRKSRNKLFGLWVNCIAIH